VKETEVQRLVPALLLALLLVGCAADKPWYQADKSPSEVNQDRLACATQAINSFPMDIGRTPDLGIGLAANDGSATASAPAVAYNREKIASQRFSAYNVCMESRGYTHSHGQS
jgi:hypothetical protein